MTKTASFALNASPSSELAVLDHAPGRWRASIPAPQCCCTSAASSVLVTPVGPTRWMLKSVPPRTARAGAARRGTVTRRGATSSMRMLALTASTSALPLGGAGSSYRERGSGSRSEEHTSELQSLAYLVCRLLLEKKKKYNSGV